MLVVSHRVDDSNCISAVRVDDKDNTHKPRPQSVADHHTLHAQQSAISGVCWKNGVVTGAHNLLLAALITTSAGRRCCSPLSQNRAVHRALKLVTPEALPMESSTAEFSRGK